MGGGIGVVGRLEEGLGKATSVSARTPAMMSCSGGCGNRMDRKVQNVWNVKAYAHATASPGFRGCLAGTS